MINKYINIYLRNNNIRNKDIILNELIVNHKTKNSFTSINLF
jgi:hypothetical protein